MIRIYSFITQQRAARIKPVALFIYDFLFGYMLNLNIQGVYDGQNAQRNHILNDKDIIELHFG